MQKLSSIPKKINNLYFPPKVDKDNPRGSTYMFKNSKLDAAVLVYGVLEVRMCTEIGLFAIINNLRKSEVILNSKQTVAYFVYDRTVVFFDPLQIVAICLSIYDEETNFWGLEYFFFHLKNNQIAFIKCPLDGGDLKKIGKYKVQMHRSEYGGEKEGYTFDLRELEWFPFEKFDMVKKKFIDFHVPQYKRRKRRRKFRNFLRKFGLENMIKRLKYLFFSETLFFVQEMRLIHRLWDIRSYKKNKRKFILVNKIFTVFRFLFRLFLIVLIIIIINFLFN